MSQPDATPGESRPPAGATPPPLPLSAWRTVAPPPLPRPAPSPRPPGSNQVLKVLLFLVGFFFFAVFCFGLGVLAWWIWSRHPATPPPRNNPVPIVETRPPAGTQTFNLKPGAHLDATDAPNIVGRDVTIEAVFDTRGQEGVIVAQGGLAHGYVLHLQRDQLHFTVRRNNGMSDVALGPVPPGSRRASAFLSKTGELRLSLDGGFPVTSRASGPITLVPVDGLDVGSDRGGLVGNYTTENAFGGVIESVTITTKP